MIVDENINVIHLTPEEIEQVWENNKEKLKWDDGTQITPDDLTFFVLLQYPCGNYEFVMEHTNFSIKDIFYK